MQRIIFSITLITALTPLAVAEGGSAVAVVDGVEIGSPELDQRVGNRALKFREQEYSLRRAALDQLVDATLLDMEAKKRNVSVEELVRTEIGSKVRPLSVEEARVACEAMHPTDKNPPSDEAIRKLSDNIRLQRSAAARSAYIATLKRDYRVNILLEPPRALLGTEGAPARGSATAPVTLIEFADFQCPFCAAAEKTLEQLRASYGDKLRIVFRNFPLPMHSNSQISAEAAMCADQQGRFWDMHDKLFSNQSALAAPDLLRYAAEVGLDGAAFERCLTGRQAAPTISKDRLSGAEADVTATPTFFVNGRIITGAASFAKFSQVVDEELAFRQRASERAAH